MRHRDIFIGVLLLGLLLFSGCAGSNRVGAPDPNGDWDTASLDDVAIRAAPLHDMMRTIDREDYAIDGVLIVRHGKLAYEQYRGMEASDLHAMYSCTKSVVSLLVGIALTRGDIESLDQTVSELLPNLEWERIDSPKEAITLLHLLTMSSGLDWPELNVPYDSASVFQRWMDQGGTVQFVMERALDHQPGSRFNYNTGGSHVVSAILTEQTGKSTQDYAREHLFAPLGIDDFQWQTDRDGIPYGGHSLRLRPRDMAKIGLLALQQGQWQGTQVVDGDWLMQSTQKHIGAGSMGAYGYHWWVYPGLADTGDGVETFGAMGYRGQHIYVIPSKDMVVVFVSALEPEQTTRVPRELLERHVLPAAQ